MDAYMQGTYDATHERGFNPILLGGVFSEDFWKYTGSYICRKLESLKPQVLQRTLGLPGRVNLANLSNKLGK
jgi:hypothetical protein